MTARFVKPKWLEILSAMKNAPRFSSFLRGVTIDLPTGQRLQLKIENVRKLPAAQFLQVYPYAYITKMTCSESKLSEGGCGEAAHPLIAIQKSISEAVERCLYRATKSSTLATPTTSGWAAHFSRKKVESSALFELLERDAVLVHALKDIPLLEIEQSSLPHWLCNWMQKELIHTNFSSLRVLLSTEGHFPTLSTALLDSRGYGVIAHGTGLNVEEALHRALAETARLARVALSGHFVGSSLNLFSMDRHVPITGPSEQAVAYAHHQPLPQWLFGQSIEWKEACVRWSQHIRKYQKNPISYEFVPITHAPLHVGFCKSSQVQNLFFGRTSDAERRGDLNRSRLEIKTGEVFSSRPHFVA